jgi:hypothetical protein
MKKTCIIGFFLLVVLLGCIRNNQKDPIAILEKDQIENIVNFNLIKTDEINKYFNSKNDDFTALEKIMTYNENDGNIFNNQGKKEISNNAIKKRMIILEYNL